MPTPHLPLIPGGAGDEGDSPEGAAVSQQSLSPDPAIVRQDPNLPATIDDTLPTPPETLRGWLWGYSRTTYSANTIHAGIDVCGAGSENKGLSRHWTGRGMEIYGAGIICGGLR
uniref:Uncharacterized protein n=1 Tax=Peronospora matthiolae TaxID=2874970 RepID=A0AAV1UNY3_9STRA